MSNIRKLWDLLTYDIRATRIKNVHIEENYNVRISSLEIYQALKVTHVSY